MEDRAIFVWKDGMAAAQRFSLRRDETMSAAKMHQRRDRL
jgi:hypothetical protein